MKKKIHLQFSPQTPKGVMEPFKTKMSLWEKYMMDAENSSFWFCLPQKLLENVPSLNDIHRTFPRLNLHIYSYLMLI